MIDVATCFGNELCWSCRELTTAEGKGNFKRVPIFISVGKSREKVVEQWDPNIWLAAFSVRLVKYAKPFTRRPIFHYSFTRGNAPIKEKHCSFSWKFLTCPPNNWVINIANLQFSINTTIPSRTGHMSEPMGQMFLPWISWALSPKPVEIN